VERIKQKMEEARKQREALQQHHPNTATPEKPGSSTSSSGTKRPSALLESGLRRYGGVAAVIAAILVTWWLGSGNQPDESPVAGAVADREQSINATGSLSRVDPTAEKLDEQITSLNDRVTNLARSVDELESRLTSTVAFTNSIIGKVQEIAAIPPMEKEVPRPVEAAVQQRQAPPGSTAAKPEEPKSDVTVTRLDAAPAAKPVIKTPDESAPASEETAGAAVGQVAASNPVTDATKTSPPDESPVMAAKPPPSSAAKDNLWVINLVSSPNKTDAERFAARAGSRGIETELLEVTVKGKQYWRVQITGFPSREAAKAYSGTARERLGLKDVWIKQR
jgi:cell division septation protein DedD